MAKSELELEEERRRAENRKASQGKGDEPRGMLSELGHKIKKNPWKTAGTAFVALAFPVGTIIAGTIAAGVVAKSGYDAHANKKASQGKGDEPRGIGAELMHKVAKNPWKTLGTVILATAFPAGTIIAGAIATGVVAKSGYDAHVNKKASKAEVSTHTTAAPPQHPKEPYSPKIAPPSTPNINKSQVKGKGGGGEHTH